MVYFSSLIFFLYEGAGANPDVVSYWTALWWCVLQATTLGASFYACGDTYISTKKPMRNTTHTGNWTLR